ncbi:hypothetical protein BS47DRAFT_298690 [Hydnum rufescens UP504]|uniref:Uncharacterized protein n=1 Tax=Hydnum rufescens UP504 TaxID=1448309 RepID=A0A9P6B6H4_9AGAM|nr:hypothetical protein BS47DRAFT_298690 [Hydnum rufescens UP504]
MALAMTTIQDQREICPHSIVCSSQIHLRLPTHPQMKRFLKPGKTARGVSLAILQPLRHLLDPIPVPGAKDVISILLDVVEGFDKTSRNSSMLLELENHLIHLTHLLEPLTKMNRHNISSRLKDDVETLKKPYQLEIWSVFHRV